MNTTLNEIIQNGGYIDKYQLRKLEKTNPNLFVVIKFGYSSRAKVKVKDCLKTIYERCKANTNGEYEYVREVFIAADDLDLIKKVLGME